MLLGNKPHLFLLKWCYIYKGYVFVGWAAELRKGFFMGGATYSTAQSNEVCGSSHVDPMQWIQWLRWTSALPMRSEVNSDSDSLTAYMERLPVNCATVATVARIMHLNWEGLKSRTQLTGICNLLTPNVKIVHTVTCNLRMQWKRS